MSWDPPDTREFAPFAPTTALVIGPHSQFVYRGLRLNDRTQLECFWVEGFSGFESPDVRVSAQENVQEDGELPDPGFSGGRTMMLTGYIRAGTYPTMLNMSRALLDASLDLFESPLLITKAAGSAIFLMPDVEIDCRPSDRAQISMEITQEDRSGLFKRNFTIALRASDPTYKSTALHFATLEPSVVSSTGRFYPRTYPLVYEELMDPAGNPSSGQNSIVVFNAGNWRSRPVLRFWGGMGSPVLTNELNGQRIIFRNDIASGDYIDYDVTTGDIVDSAGNDRAAYISTRSDSLWFEADRFPYDGNNTLTLNVSSFTPGAKVDITWKDVSK